MCSGAGDTPFGCRVTPFGNPRITARLTAPRGLSQPPTSFIGSWCQGIHRAPLLTWPQRCSRPLCSSQTTSPPRPRPPPHREPPTPQRPPPRDHPTHQQCAVCSLRTQQRARPTHQPTSPASPPPTPPQQEGHERAVLTNTGETSQPTPQANVPPSSNPHDTLGRGGPSPTPHPHPANSGAGTPTRDEADAP